MTSWENLYKKKWLSPRLHAEAIMFSCLYIEISQVSERKSSITLRLFPIRYVHKDGTKIRVFSFPAKKSANYFSLRYKKAPQTVGIEGLYTKQGHHAVNSWHSPNNNPKCLSCTQGASHAVTSMMYDVWCKRERYWARYNTLQGSSQHVAKLLATRWNGQLNTFRVVQNLKKCGMTSHDL
jgi:hypothetical protein